MEELITAWDGESVSIHRDRHTGTLMFICVHSSRLGPAAGGTRMKHYPRPADALMDGMRLSEAMSLKFGSVDLPYGGGEALLAPPPPQIPPGDERREVMHQIWALIKSLPALYSSPPPTNT